MSGFLAEHVELVGGILMGAIWTSFLFAIYIARHLP